MTEPHLTQEIVRRLLRYNRSTGVLTWRRRSDGPASWNTRYAGKEAGARWSPDGGQNVYRVIRIFDYPFLAHRIIFLHVLGEWPKETVDHHDLDGLNNRWRNIRPANRSQNGLNRRANKNSRTGIKGVSPCRDGGFRATLQVNGKWREIGTFPTKKAAAAAYAIAVRSSAGKFGRIA